METRPSLRATRSSGGGRALLVAVGLAALFALSPSRAACQATEGPGAAHGMRVSGRDIILSPPAPIAARFRFLPDGSWHRFDRELRLSAAEGEERSYSLEIDAGGEAPERVGYFIDKRRPEPPSAEPDGGLFDGPISPELRCENGSMMFWALFGPEAPNPAFEPYGRDSRPALATPRSGTATYTLVAYAEDGAGNRSAPARFVYRIAEPGLPAEPPLRDAGPLEPTPDPDLSDPQADSSSGSLVLRRPLLDGEALLVAVNPAKPPSRLGDFVVAEPEEGVARFVLSCPYGWTGEFEIYHGVLRDGSASYSSEPMVATLSYPASDPPPPPLPEGPFIAADAAGRGSFIFFPSYSGTILASVDGAEEKPYLGPIALGPEGESALVTWRGEDDEGLRSPPRSKRLVLPPVVPEALLDGVADGAVVGADLFLEPSASVAIRYELRSSGPARDAGVEMPPEPSSTSSLVGEGLAIACPPGELRRFILRYRPFSSAASGAAAGEGKLVRFAIDREPPEAPRPAIALPAYSDRPLSLAFESGEPGSSVFAQVAVDGVASPFASVTGSLELPGSEAGPIAYLVRAYRVDEAGNRSDEMASVSMVVDRSSVYAAADAADSGDGSPARPYRSLDAALLAAVAGGKRSVNVRGRLDMKAAFVAKAPIDIVGGFGAGWARDRSVRAELRVAVPEGSSAFAARGVSLSIRNLALIFPEAGGSPLFDIEGGSLVLENCSVSAGRSGDLLVARAASSRIEILRSTVTAERAMSCAIARAEGSSVELRDSVISARPGVRAFSAFDLEGGSLSMAGSLIESSADLALRLLSLRGSRLLVDRCLVRIDAGSGYLRLGSFSNVEGELRNSRFLVLWNGDGLLFETEGRSCPAFRHLTVSAQTLRGRLDFFRATGAIPEIWNSILSCASGGGVLLGCDSAPVAGSLVADCVWGFDALLAGAMDVTSIEGLNALNGGSAAYSSRRHVSESPTKTFSAPVKSLSPLARGSACIDAAYPLDGEAYSRDFRGSARPSAAGKKLPDIGADESGD